MTIFFIDTVKADSPNPNLIGFVPNEIHVTIGDNFNTDIMVNVSWEIDNVSISNITFLPEGVLNYSSTVQGNLFSGGMWLTPENDGFIDNSSGYACPIAWVNNTGVNETESLVANISWLIPIEASALSGLPGIGSGSAGFSVNFVIRKFSSTDITPNSLASLHGTSIQPTVRSASCST